MNFAAPALGLALLMPVFAALTSRRKASGPGWGMQFLVNFAACLAVLMAGLWAFGHDGRIATYAGMVLVCATSQWWMQRA